MAGLEQMDQLIVSQKTEIGEILSGFETKNKYSVTDPEGNQLYFAAEVGGSFLTRTFLKSARPFTMQVLAPDGSLVLTLNRPWRWMFYEIIITDATGEILGRIKKRWTLLRRKFSVLDGQDKELFELLGPIFKPWTFQIKNGDREVGKITKKWSGMLKEAFTDADNFGVQFPPDLDVQTKSIILGAVFLIDFLYFENKN